MDVSVVICTSGIRPTLEPLLHALSKQISPDSEIILVHPTERGGVVPQGLRDLVESSVKARLVMSAFPTGVARTTGIVEAQHDLILMTDDDCVPEPDWVDQLTQAIDDPKIAAAGGTILPRWPTGSPPRWLHDGLLGHFGRRIAGTTPDLPYAANMALRRDVVIDAGGFRSDLGHGSDHPGVHDDTELCRRLRMQGHRVEEAPQAVVHHLIRPDQLKVSWVLRRAWYVGRSTAIMYRDDAAPADSERTKNVTKLLTKVPAAIVSPKKLIYGLAVVCSHAGYLTGGRCSRRESGPARVP